MAKNGSLGSFGRRDILKGAAGLAASLGVLRVAANAPDASAQTPGARRTNLQIAISDAQIKETLDPALSEITNAQVLVGAVYDHLVRFDANYKLTPRLAVRWEASSDSKQWKLFLRQGVRWHDGRPFTGEDVAFTLKRLVDKAVGSDLFTRLSPSIAADGIRVDNDHELTLTLQRPDALLPITFGTRQAAMVPAGFETRTTQPAKAIGCGPFKITAFTPGRGWEATRNDDYYGPKPKLEGLRIGVIPEQATKLQAVITGDYQASDAIQPSLARTIQGNKDVKLVRLAADRAMTIVLDSTQKPFDDIRVRTAIKRAMDRKKLLDLAYLGYGEVTADVPTPPNSPYYPAGVDASQNIEQAKKLLSDAGFPNGLDLELITTDAFGGMVDLATAFAEVVKPAGIRVRVKQQPSAVFWDQVWLKAPMYISYWSTRHPADRLAVTYGAGSKVNESKYNNPKLEQLLSEALAASDPDVQRKVYQDALRMVAAESGQMFPFFIDKLWVARAELDLKAVYETQVDLGTAGFT